MGWAMLLVLCAEGGRGKAALLTAPGEEGKAEHGVRAAFSTFFVPALAAVPCKRALSKRGESPLDFRNGDVSDSEFTG